MTKTVKHIWKYLTSPMYRAYVDLQMTQQALDAHLNMMRDQLELSKFPPIVQEVMKQEGLSGEYATSILKAEMGRHISSSIS